MARPQRKALLLLRYLVARPQGNCYSLALTLGVLVLCQNITRKMLFVGEKEKDIHRQITHFSSNYANEWGPWHDRLNKADPWRVCILAGLHPDPASRTKNVLNIFE